jgi:catechol 2,3-dioxygenase-like lactoylglutathione lyase family enzyme
MSDNPQEMLHHLSLPVADLDRSAELYDAALSALGYRRVCVGKNFVGYGIEDDKDKFAIKEIQPSIPAGPGFHLAISAPSQAAVDRFHETALARGASDNGVPGLRKHYGLNYYAAFIIDLDGHRIEAVINEPAES